MFSWLGKKHELIPVDTREKDRTADELQRKIDALERQKKEEDHLRKSAEYGLMEASYEMYVTFVTGHQLNIHRKFNGSTGRTCYGWGYNSPYEYNYIKPSVTAAEDMQLTKDTVHGRGITDGDNVYLAHTISKVVFCEITTKGED
jgi:hypothetical protein